MFGLIFLPDWIGDFIVDRGSLPEILLTLGRACHVHARLAPGMCSTPDLSCTTRIAALTH
jgi:hypothetical protein